MRKLIPAALIMLVAPAMVPVHGTLQPRDSKPHAEERGTVGATATGSASRAQPAGEAADRAAIEAWLKGYDAAFNAKDLERLGTFYHPDVTVYEGGGIDKGWAAYRDHHLGPELKAFENLLFAHHELRVHPLSGSTSAYATARYTLKAKMSDREIDSEGLATYVIVREADGAWKIRHSHTSSRPARRP